MVLCFGGWADCSCLPEEEEVESRPVVQQVEVEMLWLVMEKWMVVVQLLWELVVVWWMVLVDVG